MLTWQRRHVAVPPESTWTHVGAYVAGRLRVKWAKWIRSTSIVSPMIGRDKGGATQMMKGVSPFICDKMIFFLSCETNISLCTQATWQCMGH